MKVRFLCDFEFARGKKAKRGDIVVVSKPIAFFLVELGYAEPYVEKEADEKDESSV